MTGEERFFAFLIRHFEINEAAEGDEGVIGKETPGEHGPESIAGAEAREDKIERALGGAGVAWGWDEGNSGLNRDGGHRGGEITNVATKRADDEERDSIKKKLVGKREGEGFCQKLLVFHKATDDGGVALNLAEGLFLGFFIIANDMDFMKKF